MSRVTLKDVAVHAGVSHQTVSNVLNDHPSIRPTTREKVLAAIAELDYFPNQAAKALREARVTTLCCAFFGHDIENISDPYRNLAQSAFIAEANASGYSMTTAFLQPDQPETFAKLRQKYLQREFGGIVLLGNSLTLKQFQQIQVLGIETVLFDHSLPANVSSVVANFQEGMATLVAHHLARGRQHLALIMPSDDTGSTAVARYQGFIKATAQHGVQAQVISGGWDFESGERAMRTLWGQALRPDAVLAGNDRMAAGALRAALELGLRVPDDIAISGFDDFEFTRYTTPSLTTVHVPHAEMARRAVQILVQRLEQLTGITSVSLDTSLVVRESA